MNIHHNQEGRVDTSNDVIRSSFSSQLQNEIETLSEGLSEDEVSLYLWGITAKELAPDDFKEFTRCYTRGRTRMKIAAVNALKNSMHGKHAMEASLAVLVRFSENWRQLDQDTKHTIRLVDETGANVIASADVKIY